MYHHSRSESTDLLYPNAQARSSLENAPTWQRSSPRAQTPPVALGTTSPHTSPPPPSSFKKNKKARRPVSLNLPLEPPPTTNNLPPEARSELLRKNRKLQQVLGNDFYQSASADDAGVTSSGQKTLSTNTPSRLSKSSKKAPILRTQRSRSFSVSSPSSATSFGDGDGDSVWSGGTVSPETSLFPPSLRMKLIAPTPTIPLYPLGSPVETTPKADTSRNPVPLPTLPTQQNGGSQALRALFDLTLPLESRKVTLVPKTKQDDIKLSSVNPIPPLQAAADLAQSPFADAPADATDNTAHSIVIVEAEGKVDMEQERGRKHRDSTLSTSSSLRASSTPPLTPLSSQYFLAYHGVSGHSSHGRSLSASTTASGIAAGSVFSPDTGTHLSPEAAAALERKKKRDRLVKLHRFLGSHVPAELVLGGVTSLDQGLPPVDASTTAKDPGEGEGSGSGTEEGNNVIGVRESNIKDATGTWGKWKGKKKSSRSGSSDLHHGSADDWAKINAAEPMTEQDRTLNVKRKVKMEKMFGEHPPQRLYLTRSSIDAPSTDDLELETPLKTEFAAEEEEDEVSPSGELRSLEFLRHRHSLISLTYLVEKVRSQISHFRNLT